MKESFVAFGGGLALAIVASLGMLAVVGVPDSVPGTPPGAVAEVFECASGATVRSSFSNADDGFRVVGRISEINGGEFRVKSPSGDVAISLAFNSQVAGNYSEGDLVQVGGTTKDGELWATDVRGGCPIDTGSFVANPTATPGRIAQNITPAATPTPGPQQTNVPAIVPVSNDDGDGFVRDVTGSDPGGGFPPPAAPTKTPAPQPTQPGATKTPSPTPTPKPAKTPRPTVPGGESPTITPVPTPSPSPTPIPPIAVLPAAEWDDPRIPGPE